MCWTAFSSTKHDLSCSLVVSVGSSSLSMRNLAFFMHSQNFGKLAGIFWPSNATRGRRSQVATRGFQEPLGLVKTIFGLGCCLM